MKIDQLFSSVFMPISQKMRNEYTILVGKPEGKTPLRKPTDRWEDI
jgi:hypothetical protein